jgi:hypothetical protein
MTKQANSDHSANGINTKLMFLKFFDLAITEWLIRLTFVFNTELCFYVKILVFICADRSGLDLSFNVSKLC